MAKVDELFSNQKVFSATDEELDEALYELSTRPVPNNLVRHRETIRGITINSIKNQRHIDRIESQNRKLTWIVIFFAGASITLLIVSLFIN